MKTILPVIIEDLIKNVTDPKKHYEQRQHYAKTLKDISDAANNALKIYESHRKGNR